MDVKEAVAAAKNYIASVFEDENIVNLGLEEIERDVFRSQWKVTLGFSRKMNAEPGSLAAMLSSPSARTYRVVTLRDNGDVISVKLRDVPAN